MISTEPARILVVDDTPTNIEVLLGILDRDHEMSFATSGTQALELLQRSQLPDLILLDVMMPDLDGYQVCEQIKSNPQTRDIPVIFVTARTDAQSETRALRSGAVDFIHKPVNSSVVRARVHLHLELRRRTLELERSLAEIARAHEQLQVLWQAIEQSPTSIVITDHQSNIQYVNPYFTRETGYTATEVLGRNPRILQSGLTDQAVFKSMWETLRRGEPWFGELINRRKSGETYWEEVHIAPVKDPRDKIAHYVAVKLNVTERKQTLERLAHMANHDVLTNLPNRALFFERLDQAMGLARRRATRLALLFIDLDKFKPINDTWGHAVGDQVLKEVADRLVGRVRSTDTVGRIGGDEFVILLSEITDAADAAGVAEQIRCVLAQPFLHSSLPLEISASIGIAIYPDHGEDAITLARHADDGMYQAKQSGGDRLRLFQSDP
ncbi:MAG: diguanylate cyclase [Sphingobacteriia bacterium]|nr:diguanylate cyclase [Sphingobacteriia bacterium]NCC40118.1 diguanylate cyclase [Gammaproteobacteria bacterium]